MALEFYNGKLIGVEVQPSNEIIKTEYSFFNVINNDTTYMDAVKILGEPNKNVIQNEYADYYFEKEISSTIYQFIIRFNAAKDIIRRINVREKLS